MGGYREGPEDAEAGGESHEQTVLVPLHAHQTSRQYLPLKEFQSTQHSAPCPQPTSRYEVQVSGYESLEAAEARGESHEQTVLVPCPRPMSGYEVQVSGNEPLDLVTCVVQGLVTCVHTCE